MPSDSGNRATDDMGGPEMAPQTPHERADGQAAVALERRVLVVCKDLFFVARIRETARLADVHVKFTRTPDELRAGLEERPRFVLVDLTGGFDYDAMFGALGDPRPPVLAFTTHALA